jgi:hypothetical protein
VARGQLADLQKERKARQDFEKRFQAAETQRETLQRQIQALTGATPRSPEDAETDQIRQHFAKLFPGLAKLDDKTIDRLLATADSAGALEQTSSHYWKRHGLQMVESVESAIAKEFGSDKLTPSQQNIVRAAYRQAAETNPEFLQRHEEGDKALIAEFAKTFVDDWFEPARRKVTAQTVSQQRPVPNGGQRSVVGASGKKIDFKDDNAFGDALAAEFRAGGGRFDG